MRGAIPEAKNCISLQLRAIDPPNPARQFIQQNQNVRLATTACIQNLEMYNKSATCAAARARQKSSLYGIFGRPTSTMKGLLATVLDVQQSHFAFRVAQTA